MDSEEIIHYVSKKEAKLIKYNNFFESASKQEEYIKIMNRLDEPSKING